MGLRPLGRVRNSPRTGLICLIEERSVLAMTSSTLTGTREEMSPSFFVLVIEGRTCRCDRVGEKIPAIFHQTQAAREKQAAKRKERHGGIL